MKSKTLLAAIQRFSMNGTQHWYVVFSNLSLSDKTKKFTTYQHAHEYAIKYVLARNITVYD